MSSQTIAEPTPSAPTRDEPIVPDISEHPSPEVDATTSIMDLWTGEFRGTTLAIFLLMFLTAFEALAVATAMPTVVADLGGIALYGIAFAAPMATGVIAMTISGFWNDKSGPGSPIMTGVTLFSLGLLVAGFAPSMLVIVMGRSLQGLGAGMLSVSLYVMIGHLYPERLRPRMFSLLAGAWVLPALIGPGIAGVVTEHLGWRWLFLGVPVLAVGAVMILRPTLSNIPRDETASDLRIGTRPLWAVAAAIGIIVLNRAGQRDDVFWPVLLVASLIAIGVSVPRLVPVGTWRAAHGLPTVIAIRGLIAAAFVGTEAYLPLLLKNERGLSPSMAGLVLTAGALSWFVGSWIAGQPEHRLSNAARIRVGALLIGAGITAEIATISPTVPVLVGTLGWGLAGLGMGLVYPILSTTTLAMSKPDEQGANSSALQINESLSGAVVLAIGGALFASLVETATHEAYIVNFGITLVLALIAAAIATRIGMSPAVEQ